MFPDAATPQAWAIVSGYILDFSSDDVVKTISRSGLDVDWSLTPEQDYSHKTRKRAYAPKIQAAYQRLSDQQKRIVVNALIGELMRTHPRTEEMTQRLGELNPAPAPQANVVAPAQIVVVPEAVPDLQAVVDAQPDALEEDHAAPELKVDPRRVFVVHGRDSAVRTGMFDFLRSIGLDPIEWSAAMRLTGKASPYIGEVLDVAFDHAQAIVVVSTPDDEVRLSNALVQDGDGADEREFKMQARPNVIFEAGMGFGRNPDRTILVEVGQVKSFSDIAGRHVVRLSNTEARRKDLADRLRTAGCSVALDGEAWKNTGDFSAVRVPAGAPQAAAAPAAANAVKFVDTNYPTDSGLQRQLEADHYKVRWSNDDKLARRLDLEGWSLVTERDANGREIVLKLGGGANDHQTLIKRKNTLPD